MWKGYRDALAAYYNACLDAYEVRRGFVNGPTMQRAGCRRRSRCAVAWRRALFHAAQRAQLLLKKPEYYSEKGWDAAPPELGVDYVFPKKQGDRWVLYIDGCAARTSSWPSATAGSSTRPRSRGRASPPNAGADAAEARAVHTSDLSQSRDELVAEYAAPRERRAAGARQRGNGRIRFDHCFMASCSTAPSGGAGTGVVWICKRGSAISQISDADLAAAVAVGKPDGGRGPERRRRASTRGRCGSGASAPKPCPAAGLCAAPQTSVVHQRRP